MQKVVTIFDISEVQILLTDDKNFDLIFLFLF